MAKVWRIALIFICIASSVNAQQIVLSSRFFHPINTNDSLSTIEAIKDFGATRVDWMYCTNVNQIAQLKKAGVSFSLATHPQLPDSNGVTTPKGRIVDVNGEPYIAPWMKNTGSKSLYWGCVNAPYFQQLFIKNSKKLVDLGAYAIMLDDARFNDQAECYCEYCMKGFNTFLNNRNITVPASFNYRMELLKNNENAKKEYGKLFHEFETESVKNFLSDWKQEISAYSHGKILFYTNNYAGTWENDIYKIFDGGIAEFEQKFMNTSIYYRISKSLEDARKLGKKQSFNFETDNENLLYGAILYTYINGAEALLPWDLWLQGKPKRFYGQKQNYEDLISLLKNVILNPAFTKVTSKAKLKRYSLPANSYICYSYSNGTDTYDIIFNFKYNALTPLREPTGKRLSLMLKKPVNSAFGRHYQNFSDDLVSGVVNSCFMVIKE